MVWSTKWSTNSAAITLFVDQNGEFGVRLSAIGYFYRFLLFYPALSKKVSFLFTKTGRDQVSKTKNQKRNYFVLAVPMLSSFFLIVHYQWALKIIERF
jgi:hypothetical protein